MLSSTYLLLVSTILAGSTAEINREEYVAWKKNDTRAFHEYFCQRLLEGERLTNEMATATIPVVLANLSDSLLKIVQYPIQELQTAQLMMEGTSAQGCVQGIADYLTDAIQEEISKFSDCSADALPQLQRLSAAWNKTNGEYQAVYQRVLAGIDQCGRTYPNRDSWGRCKTCIDSWNNTYFAAVNNIRNRYLSRPSMSVFEVLVVGCAESAALETINKAWRFLSMLVQCARLSDNIDPEFYNMDLQTEFSNYLVPIDLRQQMMVARATHTSVVSDVEAYMTACYDMQRSALERCVIESRGIGFYGDKIRGFLNDYITTIALTSLDNPSAADCASAAFNQVNVIVSEGAAIALRNDQQIVNHTRQLIAAVTSEFQAVNEALPPAGDVALINCFREGYIFADSTILGCYKIVSSGFDLYLGDVRARVERDVSVLFGYEGFFSNSSLPCAESLLRRAAWGAERALYELQRCLYVSAGTKYAVTTPPSWVTTTATPN